MKVEKITQSNSNVSKPKIRNVNMVGFGFSQPSKEEQTSSFNSKKSNEAIKSQFLSNVSFSGIKDNVTLKVERKYGPTRVVFTSGEVKILPPGDNGNAYRNCSWVGYVETPLIGEVYHARMEKSGTRASGSSAEYVAKDAITESPYYYNGSRIIERYPVSDGDCSRSVYYSDPGERMDETTPYSDYVVYAPGAYYKERTFLEKILD